MKNKKKQKILEEARKKLPKITNFFMTRDNEVHDESTSDSEKDEGDQIINETSKHLLLKIGNSSCSFISASNEVPEFIETDIDINRNIQKEKKDNASQQVIQELQKEEIINSEIEIKKVLKVSEWSAEIIRTDKFIESIVTNKPKSDIIKDTGKVYKYGSRTHYRCLKESDFYRLKPNGGKIKRE